MKATTPALTTAPPPAPQRRHHEKGRDCNNDLSPRNKSGGDRLSMQRKGDGAGLREELDPILHFQGFERDGFREGLNGGKNTATVAEESVQRDGGAHQDPGVEPRADEADTERAKQLLESARRHLDRAKHTMARSEARRHSAAVDRKGEGSHTRAVESGATESSLAAPNSQRPTRPRRGASNADSCAGASDTGVHPRRRAAPSPHQWLNSSTQGTMAPTLRPSKSPGVGGMSTDVALENNGNDEAMTAKILAHVPRVSPCPDLPHHGNRADLQQSDDVSRSPRREAKKAQPKGKQDKDGDPDRAGYSVRRPVPKMAPTADGHVPPTPPNAAGFKADGERLGKCTVMPPPVGSSEHPLHEGHPNVASKGHPEATGFHSVQTRSDPSTGRESITAADDLGLTRSHSYPNVISGMVAVSLQDAGVGIVPVQVSGATGDPSLRRSDSQYSQQSQPSQFNNETDFSTQDVRSDNADHSWADALSKEPDIGMFTLAYMHNDVNVLRKYAIKMLLMATIFSQFAIFGALAWLPTHYTFLPYGPSTLLANLTACPGDATWYNRWVACGIGFIYVSKAIFLTIQKSRAFGFSFNDFWSFLRSLAAPKRDDRGKYVIKEGKNGGFIQLLLLLDRLMNSWYVLMVYFFNIFLVFNTQKAVDMVLNSVAMEFIIELDEKAKKSYLELFKINGEQWSAENAKTIRRGWIYVINFVRFSTPLIAVFFLFEILTCPIFLPVCKPEAEHYLESFEDFTKNKALNEVAEKYLESCCIQCDDHESCDDHDLSWWDYLGSLK